MLAVPASQYVNWRTFKASGVNLGGWLVQEATSTRNSDPSRVGTPVMNVIFAFSWALNAVQFSKTATQHTLRLATSTT